MSLLSLLWLVAVVVNVVNVVVVLTVLAVVTGVAFVGQCAREIVPFLLRLFESRRTHICICQGLHVTHPVCSKLW